MLNHFGLLDAGKVWDVSFVASAGGKFENRNPHAPLPTKGKPVKYYVTSTKVSGSMILIAADQAIDNLLVTLTKNGSAPNYLQTARRVITAQLGPAHLSSFYAFLRVTGWTVAAELITSTIARDDGTDLRTVAHGCRPNEDHFVIHGGTDMRGRRLTHLHLEYMRRAVLGPERASRTGVMYLPRTSTFQVIGDMESPLKRLDRAFSDAINEVVAPAVYNTSEGRFTFRSHGDEMERIQAAIERHGCRVDSSATYDLKAVDSGSMYEGVVVQCITEEDLERGGSHCGFETFLRFAGEAGPRAEALRSFVVGNSPKACIYGNGDTRAEPPRFTVDFRGSAQALDIPALLPHAAGALRAWCEHMVAFFNSVPARTMGATSKKVELKPCQDQAEGVLALIVHCASDNVFRAYDQYMSTFPSGQANPFFSLGRGFTLILRAVVDSGGVGGMQQGGYLYTSMNYVKFKTPLYVINTMFLRPHHEKWQKSYAAGAKFEMTKPNEYFTELLLFVREWGLYKGDAIRQAAKLAYLFYTYVWTHPKCLEECSDYLEVLDRMNKSLAWVIAPKLRACTTDEAQRELVLELTTAEDVSAAEGVSGVQVWELQEVLSLHRFVRAESESAWVLAVAAYEGGSYGTFTCIERDSCMQFKLGNFMKTGIVLERMTGPGQKYPLFNRLEAFEQYRSKTEQVWLKELRNKGLTDFNILIKRVEQFRLLVETWGFAAQYNNLLPLNVVLFGAPSGSGKSAAAPLLREMLDTPTSHAFVLEADTFVQMEKNGSMVQGSGTSGMLQALKDRLAQDTRGGLCAILDRCSVTAFGSFAKLLKATTTRHRFTVRFIQQSHRQPLLCLAGCPDSYMPWGLHELAAHVAATTLRADHTSANGQVGAQVAAAFFNHARLPKGRSMQEEVATHFKQLGGTICFGEYQTLDTTSAAVIPEDLLYEARVLLGEAVTKGVFDSAPYFKPPSTLPRAGEPAFKEVVLASKEVLSQAAGWPMRHVSLETCKEFLREVRLPLLEVVHNMASACRREDATPKPVPRLMTPVTVPVVPNYFSLKPDEQSVGQILRFLAEQGLDRTSIAPEQLHITLATVGRQWGHAQLLYELSQQLGRSDYFFKLTAVQQSPLADTIVCEPFGQRTTTLCTRVAYALDDVEKEDIMPASAACWRDVIAARVKAVDDGRGLFRDQALIAKERHMTIFCAVANKDSCNEEVVGAIARRTVSKPIYIRCKLVAKVDPPSMV